MVWDFWLSSTEKMIIMLEGRLDVFNSYCEKLGYFFNSSIYVLKAFLGMIVEVSCVNSFIRHFSFFYVKNTSTKCMVALNNLHLFLNIAVFCLPSLCHRIIKLISILY